MTREERAEAKNIMSQMIKDEEGFLSDNTVEAHKMAIKALEQEPILDKIRAEIEAEIKGCETAIDMYKENPDIVLCYKTFIQSYTKTLQIIDKYIEEQEDADSN